MPNIRPSDLPPAASVTSDAALVVDSGASVDKATPLQIMDAARPIASQAEAEAGTDNAKIVTPLRVAQAVTAAIATPLTAKENSITAGTTAQYWRGDKTWQTLNKTVVGLANVDNTADTAKPVSTAQAAAIAAKQATLVSGTNIRTVGGATLLGTGDVGTIGVGFGGTGATSMTAGRLPKGNGTGAYTASIAYDNGIGSLLFGTTSTVGLFSGASVNPGVNVESAGSVSAQRNTLPCMFLGKAAGFTNAEYINFYYNGSAIGGIVANTLTSVAFNTTSDQTLKIDDGELSLEDALSVLTLIVIHNYRWKSDGTPSIGPFAQELHKVCPAAVTVGGWWQHRETGERREEAFEGALYAPWQVDNSKLMPIVVRVAQGHEARLAALEAKAAA